MPKPTNLLEGTTSNVTGGLNVEEFNPPFSETCDRGFKESASFDRIRHSSFVDHGKAILDRHWDYRQQPSLYDDYNQLVLVV